MEKLPLSLLICLWSLAPLFGQDSLCVFSTQGTVYFQTSNSKVELHKGDYITNMGRINVTTASSLLTVDNEGTLYYINRPGNHDYKHLVDFKKNQSSFTSRYFKYIWQEMKSNSASQAVIAGVYRGRIPMRFPRDSASMVGPSMHFTWNDNPTKVLSYFFLRNKETGEVLKIATNGTELILQSDQAIFARSKQFEWTVSFDPFPSLKNLIFYQFEHIDHATYTKRKKVYAEFIADLKVLELKPTEIDLLLCQEFGLCK